MRNRRSLLAGLSGLSMLLLAGAGVIACSSSSDDAGDEANEPTFAKTIEPLVQEKCQSCHRAGGIAPFSLVTYEEVKAMSALAKGKVQSREMPPWGAFSDESCQVQHAFKDDLSLTDAQIDSFVKWVERGAPLGDASKRLPPKTTFGATALIDKTNTYELAAPYEVPGGGKDDIQCFPIDPGFATDTWVGGSNVVPGDPGVVHHVIVYVDPNREGVTKAAGATHYPCFGGPDVKNPSLLLAWAPGVPPVVYGEETGLKVPKDSHLIMQVHYHPGQKTVLDRTAVEIKTLPYKPSFVAQIILAGNAESPNGTVKLLPGPNDPAEGPAFLIPSNVADHTESMTVQIPEKIGDVTVPELSVTSVGAHMHWAGVDMKIEVDRKTQVNNQPKQECLLSTPKYDFNWQRGYTYDLPFDQLPIVGPGDTIKFTCKYDNTKNNRHVQRAMSELRMTEPPDIRLGETTLDEMCLGAIVVLRRATLLD